VFDSVGRKVNRNDKMMLVEKQTGPDPRALEEHNRRDDGKSYRGPTLQVKYLKPCLFSE